MTSRIKNPHPQSKNFFRVQTRRLAVSFETFIGSLEHTGPEKFPRKATSFRWGFFGKSPKAAGRERVKKPILISKQKKQDDLIATVIAHVWS